MATDSETSVDSTSTEAASALYQHSKRPEWGLAILAWDRGSRRAFQFEDGKLRVFKQGYYEMVEPVTGPVERAAETVAELERKLGSARTPAAPGTVASREELTITFEDQLRIFAIEYPEGFQDPEWARGKRGEGVPRRLKRHRDAAVTAAQSSLEKERVVGLIAEEHHEELLGDAVAILDGTDLVTRKQVQTLSELVPALRRGCAAVLSELLHGDGPYQLRFERFVATMSRSRNGSPSWQLATALPALVHPTNHICIRPASMRKQAQQMSPEMPYGNTPSAPLYTRFLELSNRVREALETAGLAPRDLLDVHDFVAETMRPSAKKLLEN